MDEENIQKIYLARTGTDIEGKPLRNTRFALHHVKYRQSNFNYDMSRERVIGYLEGISNLAEGKNQVQIRGYIPEEVRNGAYPKIKMVPVKPDTLASIVYNAVRQHHYESHVVIVP